MRARVDDVESRGRIGSRRLRGVPAHPRGGARGARRVAHERPERIALTHSTSGGSTSCSAASTFAEGDEIVTTDNEHPGLLEPLAGSTRRYGVVVRVAEVLHGADPLAPIAR